jgi:Mor family transcriptional regulator
MTIYYLYVKTHNKTGLKYLGYTGKKDPYKYKGSGKYWTRHIKKHGYDVTTEILKECSTKDEIKYWGLYYSNLWNIVEAKDNQGVKLWANLKLEQGDGGGNPETFFKKGPDNIMYNEEVAHKHLQKINLPEIKNKHKEAMIKLHKNLDYKKKRGEKISKKLQDPTIYTFYHIDGTVENCTRSDLFKKYNLPGGHIHTMIRERHRIVKGWRVKSP